MIYLWFALGIILMDLTIKCIKAMFHGTSYGVLKRPIGARGCDAFCVKGDFSGKPGFPSGHVAASAFFFTMLWFISPLSSRVYIFVSGFITILLVAIARVQKKCHNMFQVISGGLYGFLFSIVWFKLFKT